MEVMLFTLHFKAREQFVAEKQTDWICTLGNHGCCKIKMDERRRCGQLRGWEMVPARQDRSQRVERKGYLGDRIDRTWKCNGCEGGRKNLGLWVHGGASDEDREHGRGSWLLSC